VRHRRRQRDARDVTDAEAFEEFLVEDDAAAGGERPGEGPRAGASAARLDAEVAPAALDGLGRLRPFAGQAADVLVPAQGVAPPARPLEVARLVAERLDADPDGVGGRRRPGGDLRVGDRGRRQPQARRGKTHHQSCETHGSGSHRRMCLGFGGVAPAPTP